MLEITDRAACMTISCSHAVLTPGGAKPADKWTSTDKQRLPPAAEWYIGLRSGAHSVVNAIDELYPDRKHDRVSSCLPTEKKKTYKLRNTS